MPMPTQAELTEYREKLDAMREAGRAGEDTDQLEKELVAFMEKTGIANEAPVTDFPELSDEGKP